MNIDTGERKENHPCDDYYKDLYLKTKQVNER